MNRTTRLIKYMDVVGYGDPDLGVPRMDERMPLNIHIEEEDLEIFRNKVRTTFMSVLGDDVEVFFSHEMEAIIPPEVVVFDKPKKKDPEPRGDA